MHITEEGVRMNNKYWMAAAALVLAVGSGGAWAGDAQAAAGMAKTQPNPYLLYMIQQVRAEQRARLGKSLRADWVRMAAAASDEVLARRPAGGPGNGTVKSEP